MAKPANPRFDAAEAITNELVRIIERGTLPWRKPWKAGGSTRPLRQNGEAYQGINNFLLTLRTLMAGHGSPFWMTMPQANALGGRIRKGEKSVIVVYYGQSNKQGTETEEADGDDAGKSHAFRFQKSYRVFNADQIDGLPERFHPVAVPPPDHAPCKPIPHMQAFFEAIDITTVFTGREAYYLPAVDKVYMPEIALFEDPRAFYGVWAHELSHNAALRFMPRLFRRSLVSCGFCRFPAA